RELGVAVHASVGIFDHIFAQTIVVDDLTAQTITAQQKLCVGTTCVTESQLQGLLNGSGSGSGSGSGGGSGNGSSTPDTIPPTVTLLGDATTTVAVNAQYIDAGASVSDNVDGNGLSYTISVDGAAAV